MSKGLNYYTQNEPDLYRYTKLIVTDPTDSIYREFPNPPMGAVFNNYSLKEHKISKGVIDTSAVANTVISLLKFYEKSGDTVYLHRGILVAQYLISTGITSKFYGKPFYLIPSRRLFKNGVWNPVIEEINVRTQYQALWVMSEMYRVTKEITYRNEANKIIKTVGSILNHINGRVAKKSIPSYMSGGVYDVMYLVGTASNSSFTFSYNQFSLTNGDVMAYSINSFIKYIGNTSQLDYESIAFMPSSILLNYGTHMKALYNNGMLTMIPTGLPYAFIKNGVACNWDWIGSEGWGNTWFVNDSVFWLIDGLANLGKTDPMIKAMAKKYRDNFLTLRVTNHSSYANAKNEILFYDRYKFDGKHLIDDDSISISGTALFWMIDEHLGVQDKFLHDKIVQTLKTHRHIESNNLVVDGAYGWNAVDRLSPIEMKATGEIYHSKFIDYSLMRV